MNFGRYFGEILEGFEGFWWAYVPQANEHKEGRLFFGPGGGVTYHHILWPQDNRTSDQVTKGL